MTTLSIQSALVGVKHATRQGAGPEDLFEALNAISSLPKADKAQVRSLCCSDAAADPAVRFMNLCNSDE